MRKVTWVAVLLCGLAVVLSGCSSAGPFVTNISSDGQGGLLIEKDTVNLNNFTGTISSGGRPTTSYIKLNTPSQ